jgi:hypothetical protein
LLLTSERRLHSDFAQQRVRWPKAAQRCSYSEAILTQRLLAFPGVFLWEHLCVRVCVRACVRVFVSRRWTGA